MELQPTTVTIDVISASNLPNEDIIGKSDPYAVLTCGDWTSKTKVIDNNLNPEWNESMFYYCK